MRPFRGIVLGLSLMLLGGGGLAPDGRARDVQAQDA